MNRGNRHERKISSYALQCEASTKWRTALVFIHGTTITKATKAFGESWVPSMTYMHLFNSLIQNIIFSTPTKGFTKVCIRPVES
jgi:hypothetical protein